MQRGFLDCKWMWRWFWCGRLFGQNQRCFSNTCACVFNDNLDWICFCMMRFIWAANHFCQQFGCFWNLCKWCVWRELGNGDNLFLKRWWIHHQWIHQHDEDVFRPPPLHVAKAKQLKQKKFNYSMLHVHDRQLCFRVFLCGKRIWEFSDSRRVFGEFVFNLLNARRGVKPTPFDVRSATSGCN